jgi:hypothetical protein
MKRIRRIRRLIVALAAVSAVAAVAATASPACGCEPGPMKWMKSSCGVKHYLITAGSHCTDEAKSVRTQYLFHLYRGWRDPNTWPGFSGKRYQCWGNHMEGQCWKQPLEPPRFLIWWKCKPNSISWCRKHPTGD